MHYILFVFLFNISGQLHPASVTAEFNSQSACLQAAKDYDKMTPFWTVVRTICEPQG